MPLGDNTPEGSPPDDEVQAFVMAAAQEAFNFLTLRYPSIAAVDPGRLEEAAKQAAGELPMFQNLHAAVADHELPETELGWSMKVIKPSRIVGGADEVIASTACPMDIGVAGMHSANMLITTLSVTALTRDYLTRAELYLQGYRLNFGFGAQQTQG